MILFFDTETTGLWKDRALIGDPVQPRVVQIAALLTENDGTPNQQFNFIVHFEGEVPEIAAGIHGITTQISQRLGIGDNIMLAAFEHFLDKADIVVCHNEMYDRRVMLNLIKLKDGEDYRDPFQDKEMFCTMLATTQVCKIKSQRGGYKWPKLQEAYKFFFGKEFDDAHDALADVRACRDVYFALQAFVADKLAKAA